MLIIPDYKRCYLNYKELMFLQDALANGIDITPCTSDRELTSDLRLSLYIQVGNSEDFFQYVYFPVFRLIVNAMNANGKSKRYWIHVFQHANLNIFDYVKQK